MAKLVRWSPTEKDLLRSLLAVGESPRPWDRWAGTSFTGRTGKSLRSMAQRLGDQGAPPTLVPPDNEEHIFPQFLDKKEGEIPDFRDYLKAAIANQELTDRASNKQRIATVKIPSPSLILYGADWHLGNIACDYGAWKDHIKLVMGTPGVYIVTAGDLIENMRSFRSLEAVLSQALTPPQQAIMLEGIVIELCQKGKLLASITGGHDDHFDERIFGQSLQAYIHRRSNAPLFANRGLVFVHVGNREYSHLLLHQVRYNSFLNALHGVKREYQLSYPANVIVGAHNHQPGIEYYWHYQTADALKKGFGGLTVLMKVGTFATTEYGWRFWGGGMEPIMPCIVFSETEMVAFPYLKQGIRYLQVLQAEKKQKEG